MNRPQLRRVCVWSDRQFWVVRKNEREITPELQTIIPSLHLVRNVLLSSSILDQVCEPALLSF